MPTENEEKKIPEIKPGASKKPFKPAPFHWMIIAMLVITIMMILNGTSGLEVIKFSEFQEYIEKGYVETVKISPSSIKGSYNQDGLNYLNGQGKKVKEFQVNYNAVHDKWISDNVIAKKLDNESTAPSIWEPLLWNLGPLVLLIVVFYFLFARNMKGGGGMLMSFGRSKHKLQSQSKITFDQVAGIEEAKEEVQETIEFLKNPKRFLKIGGRIPRGVLLAGPPGCGKTLLAKAIAGQANVPFFSISGSDFVEMFVGVGASRVRDLFKQAKENSPCIIFLDEVDAIGKKRGPGFASGGHDEREQTLNAILVEMDGFDTSDQVIVVAATNRVDILDNALTRPGRFDRQIFVPLPDLNGRAKILEVHAKKIKIGPDVNFDVIARGTPMFSGAELEALINEAAIGATMAHKDYVEQEDLEEARDKVRWGRAKRSSVVDEKEKLETAYHEAGHTIIQYLLDDADPLHKVSIIPRGFYGGATFALPIKDRRYYTKKYCEAFIQVCFGGRIAEELFCDDIGSGAQNDIQQATNMAKRMIVDWGMSEKIGMVSFFEDNDEKMFYGEHGSKHSDKTAEVIDSEIKRVIDEAYDKARELIEEHKEIVTNIAKALLKYETLDAEEVKRIIAGEEITKPTVGDLLKAEQEKSEALKAEAELSAEEGDLPDKPEPEQEPKEPAADEDSGDEVKD